MQGSNIMGEKAENKEPGWKDLARKAVNERKKEFVRSYEENSIVYTFNVNHIEPFGYATIPILLDYTLVVDIEKINKRKNAVETLEHISLGASFKDSHLREEIPFGEEYRKEIDKDLYSIIKAAYTSAIEKIETRSKEMRLKMREISRDLSRMRRSYL